MISNTLVTEIAEVTKIATASFGDFGYPKLENLFLSKINKFQTKMLDLFFGSMLRYDTSAG